MKYMGYSVAFIGQCRLNVAAKSNNLLTSADQYKSDFVGSLLKTGRRLLLALLLITFSGVLAAQTIYYWIGGTSGNYNDSNNWSLTVGGSSVASNPGTSNSIVFVVDGSDISDAAGQQTGDVTIYFPNNTMTHGGWRIVNNANVTITHSANTYRVLRLSDQAGTELQVESGCVLELSFRWRITLYSNSSALIDGLLIINRRTFDWSNGFVTVNGTITNNGADILSSAPTMQFNANSVYNHDMNGGTIPAATWDATSTVNVNGVTGTAPGGFNQTFGNLNINGAGITGDISILLTGETVVQGDFYITGSSPRTFTLATSNFNFTVNGSTTIDAYGVIRDVSLNQLNRFDGLVTVETNGSFYVTSGVSEFRGGITNNGSFINDGLVTFSGSALQVLSGSSDFNIGDATTSGITITDATSVELSSDLFFSGSAFAVTTTASSAFSADAGVFYFNRGSAQSMTGSPGSGDVTFNYLDLSSNNVKTLNYPFYVAMDLIINSGTTLNMGTNANSIDVDGTVLVEGTLDFSGSSAKVFNTFGDFDASSGIVTMNGAGLAHELNLYGSYNDVGTFNTTAGSGSIVRFSGVGDQSVFASNNYVNIGIQGGGEKLLSENTSVSGTINFVNGVLQIGEFNLTLTSNLANPFTGTLNSTSMVATDGLGYVIRNAGIASGIEFALGSGGYYSPLVIDAVSPATGTISVRAVPGSLGSNFVDKYWDIKTGTDNPTVSATFNYSPAECGFVLDTVYYMTPTGLWTGTNGNISFGSYAFSVSNTTDLLTTSTYWSAAGQRNTYYSYQTGDWNSASTWTTDPSGSILIGSQVPSVYDEVVILSDRTVYLSNDIPTEGLSLRIESGGFLDMAGYRFEQSISVLEGEGTLKLGSDQFPTVISNTFVDAGGGTVQYYTPYSFTLPNYQDVYNNLVINTSGNTALQMVDFTLNGDLEVENGTYQINDASSTTPLNLTVIGDVNVHSNGAIMVGTGPTNGTIGSVTIGGTAPFTNYYNGFHTVVFYGDFTNDGYVRFTNLEKPLYNSFPSTTETSESGAASVYFMGSSNNVLTAGGVTDFYNLIVDKGTDQTFSLTIQSSSYDNFRLFGANMLAAESADPNANMRKALWIRTGTLVLDGLVIVPSLAEGTTANSNYIIPSNGALNIDGADVLVNTTADDYREINVAYGIDAGSTGSTSNGAIGINIGNYGALEVHGTLQVNNGQLSTKESAGIIASNTTGQIIVNGGTVDAKQLLFETGSAYYSQSGGVTVLRGRLFRTPLAYTSRNDLFDFSISTIGTSRAENGINNGFASFDLENGTNIFVMSGGTVRIYDATTTGDAMAFKVNSAPGNYSVTGGTVSFIPVTGSILADATSLVASSTSPIGGLNIERPSGSTNVVLGTPFTVVNNLTMVSGVLNSNNNNLTIGGDISLSNTSTYNAGTNTTTLNGAGNQSFIVNCSSALTLNNLTVNKSAGKSVTLSGSQSSIVVTDGLNLTLATLNDGGKTISVAGDIYNSGLHNGSGRILLNGTSGQTITGDGIFGNVELFNTDGAVAPVTLGDDMTINGDLVLSNDKLFNIAINRLIFNDTASVVNAGGSRYIMSSGNVGDGGVTKVFSSSNNSFTFPVGAPTLSPARTTKYTPATIGFTSDPTTYGSVTVVPVGYEQPNVSVSGQNLTYYWKVKSFGFTGIIPGSVSHLFSYDQSDVVGTETDYVPALFRTSALAWSTGTYGIDFVTNTITDWETSADYLDGDYTVGDVTSFGVPEVYYSRQTGSWNNVNTWSLSGHTIDDVPATVPGANDIVIIGGTDSVYLQTNNTTPNTGAVQVATLMIETGSALDAGYNPASNFATVATHSGGNGNFRVAARYTSGSTFEFPNGDFTDFNQNLGTTELYTTNSTIGTTYWLPNDVASYGNMIISPLGGSNIIFPNTDLLIYGDLITRGQNAGSWYCPTWSSNYPTPPTARVAKTITIKGNFKMEGGSLVYYDNYNLAMDFIVYGDMIMAEECGIRAWNHAYNQSFQIGGSLINDANAPAGGFYGQDYCRGANFDDIPLTFFGDNNAYVTNTSNANCYTSFDEVTVNKGTSQDDTLIIDIEGTLNTPVDDWLTLQNGTLVYNRTNPSSNFTITTASPFTIPETAGLTVDYTTTSGRNVLIANSNTDNNDLYLNGKLTVVNGNLYIGPTGSPDNNNDIEYSGSSNSSITVTGGNLTVNGQIRRSASTTNGALSYTQSGGSVTINGRNTLTTRAKLEVLNGGSFNMSGGSLTIVRGGGTSFGDLYLRPATSNVTGGTIYLAHNLTGNPQTYGLETNVSLYNLVITGRTAATAADATVNMMISPLVLKGSLTLTNANSILNANNLNVTIGSNFVNDGTYTYGTNTTTFNGGSQTITGSTLSNFYNLEVSSSTSLTVNNSFVVSKNLSINSGTLVLGDYGVSVAGNVLNNGAYLDNNIAGSGLILNGTVLQQISGTGAFNRIELNNTAGARIFTDLSLTSDLELTRGVLDIGSYGLLLNQTSHIIAGNPFGTFNMIKTDGVASSPGVRKYFGTGAQIFTFPLGVSGKYTPAIFDITQNNAAGYINVVPVDGHHPGVDDPSQVLDYYWNIDNGGMDLAATVQFKYSQIDVAGTESNYLPSRLVYPVNLWYQYDLADVDDVNNTIDFSFTYPTTNLNGDYTAGIDPAIDDRVPKYQSNQDGDWSDPAIWTALDGSDPCPPGGPYGADVIVDHDVMVDVGNIFANSVTINGVLRISPSTTGHNFTELLGDGTLYVESGNIPGGDYSTFTDCIGNATIEYGGTTDYTIIASLYDNIPNLIFSGTGTRVLPNKDLTICKRFVIDGPTVDNSVNDRDLYIRGTMERYGTGEFVSGTGIVTFEGTGIQSVGGPLGDFSGSSSFYDLTIDNSDGLNIGENGLVEVSNNLNLSSGIINTTATNRLFISNTSPSAVIPSGGQSTSYINGPLTKTIMNGASFLFPIGNGPDKSVPFTVTSAAGTGIIVDFTAAYHVPNPVFSPLEPTITGVNSDEYWSVSSSISSSLQLSIAYNSASGLTPLMIGGDINDMTIAEFDTGIWSDLPTSVSGSTASGVITMTGTTSVSATSKNFTTASTAPILPKVSLQPAGGGYTVCGLTEGIPIKFSPSSLDIDPPVVIQYRVNGGSLIDIVINDTEYLDYTIPTPIPGIYELRTFTFDGTPGVVDETPVTVYEYPSGVDAGPDYSGCGDYETTLAASPPGAGESGLWTIITGSGGQFTGVDGNTQYNAGFKGLSGQSYTLRWTITNTVGGCSASDDVTISFPVAPSQPGNFTSGPVNVCQGSTYVYAVPNVAGNTYNWSYSGIGVTFSGNTNSVTATFASNATSGTVSVTASNSCGTSAYARELSVNVHSLPTPSVVGATDVCPLSSGLTYQTSDNVGSTYSWTITGGSITAGSGTSNVTVTWGSTGTGTISVTETNSSGCTATSPDLTVNISDTTPPVISDCPGDITVNNDLDECGAYVTWTEPTANDNCSGPLSYSSRSHAPGTTLFPVGTTLVTYTFADASSNTSTCTFNVTVVDAQLPSVSASGNVSVNTSYDGTGDCTAFIAITDASVSDNCSGVTLSWTMSGAVVDSGTGQIGGYTFPSGITTIIYTATDAALNTRTSSMTVTVVDNENPVPDVATLPDITAECSVTTLTAPTATDNCVGSVTGTTATTLPITTQGTTVVTWTYDDGNGNTVTQNQNVIIDDITAPVPDLATLPDITAECEITTLTAPTATDNCVGSVTGTTTTTLPITAQGTTVVTWTYDDGNGNTSTQTQTVIVDDVTAPVPDVATLPDVTGECSATVSVTPTATDNCSGSVTGTTTDPLTYSAQGTYTITWTYDDGNGNTSTQTQTVIVDDVTAPVPDVATLPDVTGECSATVSVTPTATDNCSGSVTGTTTDPLTYSAQGTYTITWTYDDGNGNTSTQTQTVIVDDVTAPVPDVATLPDVTGECSATVSVTPTATDNCSGSVTGTTTDPLTYSAQGTYTITWTYDDGNGNTSTQTQTVIVDDVTAPVPDVATLPDVTGECSATVSVTPTATDNCSGSVTGTTTDPLTYSAQGTYTITWTYDDGNGNTSTQTQTVIVDDVTAPVPDVATLPDVTGECSATVSVTPTATDNCSGSVTGTTTDPLTYSAQGTYTITWTYDDGNGNTSTQTQTVIVDDVTAPVPDVATLPDVTGECSATVSVTPTATDNCSGSVTGTTTDPLTYSAQGTYTITWTYDDGNGNTSTQTQTVIVDDVTAPVPDVATLPDVTGECSATVSVTPTATDNCSGSVTGTTTDPLTYSAQGTYTITWTYDDGNGNTSTQTQTVIVDDVTAPVPDVATLPDVTGECSATVSVTPTATDNCSGSVTGTTTDPLTYSAQGTYTITWTYDDGNGNTSTQTQTVIVDDVTAPVPDVATLPDVTGECSATVSVTPTATDNCSGSVTGTTTDPLTYSAQGTYTITWTYDDGNGNTSTQTQTVIVDDVTAPVPDVATLPDVTGECSATVSVTPTATDNCSGSVTGTTTDPLTYSAQGTYTITWTYDDGNGNTSTQTQTVIVDDVTAPVPDVATLPDVTGECSATVSVTPTATDNCSGSVTGTTTDPLTYSAQGTYTITWTYDDGNGNTSTQTQTVIVDDVTAPVPDVATLPDVTGECSATVSVTPTATDNCSGSVTGTTTDPLTYSAQGTYTITWTYDDGNGNTSTQTQTVIVDDVTAPVPDVATLPDVTGECSATVSVTPTATDNCSGSVTGTTTDPLTYSAQGTYTITWTYDDGNGNTSTQTQTVIVDDVTAPVPDVATLPDVTGECSATVSVTPTATDNCSGSVTGTTTDPLTYSAQGTYTITWTYDDGNGNTSTQTQTVIVDDVTAPVPDVATLPDVTGECSATVSVTPTATDNCSGSVTGTTTDPLTYSAQGTYTITWTYDDGNGNTSTQTQTVIVDDVTAPVPDVATLPDVTGECSATVSVTPTATDNCSGSVTGTTTDPLTYSAQGTYTITWTYDDGNGNTSTQTQTVIVDDVTAPVPDVATLPDVTGECSATVSVTPTATDNCSGSVTGTTTDPLTYSAQGTYTITWTYDDGNGNTSTQTQTVIVDDVTAPVPDVATLPDVTGECSATVSVTPTATDNCSGSVTGTTTDPLTYSAQGTYTITWTYDDGNGNTSTQTQTVIVDDVTAPVPDVATLPDVTGECSATVSVTPTATDNCSGSVTGTTTDPLTYSAQGTYTITWTYDDGNGNTSTQTQTVIVDDVTAPVPDVATLPDVTGECSATVSVTPTATDNCSGSVTGTTTDPLTYSAQGTYTITWTYDDGNGNTSTQTQTVIVDDVTAPVPDVATLPDVTGECSATVSVTPTATDNCSGSVTGTTTDPLTYSAQGTYTITWTYDDGNGNTSTQTQTVIVDDVTAPVPDVATLPDVTGECSATVSVTPTATDNCSGSVTGTTTDPLTYSAQGTYTITWTYDDGNGNTSTQTQTVIVDDVTAPVPDVATLPDVTGECSATVSVTPTATDNCSGSVTGTTTDPLTYSAQGTYTITWTYDDGNGNTSTQTQTVIVDDVTAPVPDVATLPDVTGECSATVSVTPTATDNCSGSVTGTTTDPLTYSAQGTYTITWTYDDGNGNTSTQTQTVIVDDVTAPVPDVATLPDVTGECSATVSVTPTATDNCSGSVTGTTTDPLTYSAQGTYTITWTYDDGNGNTSTQTQTVIVDGRNGTGTRRGHLARRHRRMFGDRIGYPDGDGQLFWFRHGDDDGSFDLQRPGHLYHNVDVRRRQRQHEHADADGYSR